MFYAYCCCSVTKSRPTLGNTMDFNTPGSSVLHYLLVVAVVQSLSCVWLCNPMNYSMPWFLCSSLSPWVCTDSCPSSQWYHTTISSSVVPFSSCLQSFPAWGSFRMNRLFTSGGQSIGVSASVLLMNIRDWFPLGWTGLISLQSKGLSRVFSSTPIRKH